MRDYAVWKDKEGHWQTLDIGKCDPDDLEALPQLRDNPEYWYLTRGPENAPAEGLIQEVEDFIEEYEKTQAYLRGWGEEKKMSHKEE